MTRMADLGGNLTTSRLWSTTSAVTRAGVAGIYNRAVYANEKRRALELWADHVEALVAGRASNVVTMPRRA